ncbi:MAG: DUF177 domain-containing protein [Candidatus Glassbacteria bacterium]|nr:DUF177 domain-containing protein [Candidatus Glassbacteria bacterium]
MSVLKIDLRDLRSGSFRVEGNIGASQLGLSRATGFFFTGPLVLRVRISTTNRLTYYVSGWVSFEISGECARCLKELSHEDRIRISGVFAFPEAVAKLDLTEKEVEQEGIFPLEAGQKIIDLTDLVRESVVLEYPRFLKCTEQCKGLCPVCGCDLNEKVCNCRQNAIDPRWAKLAELKRKG